MPNAANSKRRESLRRLLYQASAEGWPFEQLAEAIDKLYGKAAKPRQPRQGA